MRARLRSTPLPPLWPPTSSSCSTRHAPPPPPRQLIPPHYTALSLSLSSTHTHTDIIFFDDTHTRAHGLASYTIFLYILSLRDTRLAATAFSIAPFLSLSHCILYRYSFPLALVQYANSCILVYNIRERARVYIRLFFSIYSHRNPFPPPL